MFHYIHRYKNSKILRINQKKLFSFFFFLLFIISKALTTLENIISRLRDLDEGGKLTPPASPPAHRQPRSSPASPAPSKKNKRNQSASPIRHILNSPLLNRRHRRKPTAESSDEDNGNGNGTSDEISNKQYRDLETFQKAQLRQKVRIIFFFICQINL